MAAATVSIHLEAQTATLKKGFDEAKQAIGSLDANMGMSVAKGMAMFNVGLGAVKSALAAVQGAISAVMNSFSEMDKMADMAARLGASGDQLTALGFAAQMSGSSTEALTSALEKMQNQIGEAAAGTQSSIDAFGRLGLTVDELKDLSTDEAFAKIAEQMQGVGSSTERTKIALDIFGRSGGELIQLLSGGAEGLNKFGAEAGRLGLLMGDAREGVGGVNDAIDKMKMAWGTFISQVAVAVAPALTAIAEALATVVGWFNRLMGSATGATGTFKSFSSETKKASIIVDKEAEALKKKADAEAEAAKKSMADRGKAMADSLRTPMEIYRDKVAELNELVANGALSWDVYARGVNKAAEELIKGRQAAADWKTPGIGAVTRNSAEGFSAVQSAKRERDDSERRHKESIATLLRIVSAIHASSIEIVPVRL